MKEEKKKIEQEVVECNKQWYKEDFTLSGFKTILTTRTDKTARQIPIHIYFLPFIIMVIYNIVPKIKL